ncbi:MAG: protein kinase, partial [Planctomycetota bacterium]
MDEILEGVHAGRLTESTLCWCEGMAEWLPLRQVKPFAAQISRAVPAAASNSVVCREEGRPMLVECPNCHRSVTTEQSSGSPGGLQCPHCGSTVPVFDQNTLVVSDRSHVESSPAPIDPHIEGYEILDTLGEGGMGIVYAGRQRSLDRKVAIKVLSPVLAKDPNFLARFEREIAILVRLSHPHIVTIFDQGRSSTGLLYYVMEYVEGEHGGPPKDLQRLISDRCLDSERTRELTAQVVQALGFAHREGVVHRDVKPSNVLIDRHGFAKVADFGIAGIRTGHQAQHLTMANTSVGTMIYMSPEQHQDAASVDHRTDIYSTGVVLYQMLIGELPFPGYELPSRAVPGLSPQWDAIITKALQPKPENRFADMAEFEEALKSLEQTPAVRPDSGSGTQAGAEQTTSPTSPPMTCAQCGAGVSENDQFCLQCGASVWVDCRQCGKRVFAGARFCPTCRADVQSVRLFEEHLQLGKGCFEKAKGEPRLVERVRQVEQARLTLAKALNYMDDSDARSLLDEANHLTAECAWQAGETAFHTRRLAEASYCYEQVLEVSPDHAAANTRLEKIRAHRADLMNRARRLFEEGNLKKAVDLLGTAARSFGGDEEIAGLLAEYGEKTQCIKELQARIATLARENKWCEVSQLVADLRQSGIPIKGLDEYAARVQEKLKLVEPLVAAARLSLEKGDPVRALAQAHQVLEQISDHLEAMEIAELAPTQPVPRRWGRRLVGGFVGLVCLVAVGAFGYFEVTEVSALRRAEQQIEHGEYDEASKALTELRDSPYHTLIGGYLHDRKTKYLLAIAGIEAYASGKKGRNCVSYDRSTELLKQALGDSEEWHGQAGKDLANVLALVPEDAADAPERSLAIARDLFSLQVRDGKHWAKALFDKAKKISDATDRPIVDLLEVEFVAQILYWDASLAEHLVAFVLPDPALDAPEFERRLQIINGWVKERPSLADPLVSGVFQRAKANVADRKYDKAIGFVRVVGEIGPGRDAEISTWLEEQAKKAGELRHFEGAVAMLDYMISVDRGKLRGAAELYLEWQKKYRDQLPLACPSIMEKVRFIEAEELVRDAERALLNNQYVDAIDKSQRAIALIQNDDDMRELINRADKVLNDAHCLQDLKDARALIPDQLERALELAQGVLARPADPKIHNEARELIVQINRTQADQYMDEGRKAMKERDFDSAIEWFRKAREIQPDDPDILDSLANAHVSKARELKSRGDFEGVLEEYDNALAIRFDPEWKRERDSVS